MVDWHDPVIVARCARTAMFIQDLSGGCYIWEFLISLPFDWEHYKRKYPFRWPQVAYFGSRYLLGLGGLMAFRTSLVFGPTNCQAWFRASFATAHACGALGSLLLFMRVIALSGRNKYVIGILGFWYLCQCAALVHTTIRIRGEYMPDLLLCAVTNTSISRINYFISFGFDFACLCIVFGYLFQARGAGLWDLLVSQGAVYFMVVIAAYTPPAILLILNLNDFMNTMLQVPSVVVLVVCANRMYRNLIDFYARLTADLTS
ncbi:hypothetical protein AURDEDRAFT_175538 [Auricularia subglabra TFB-10046 SS5]|uniref:Uncharacterized protein n=1 Tax=Auricularia subglabra (strain TFB-10046 / SS5) TaxID=717982 RepID=J0WRN7_AURST|nr:hypothetical protein AURDEDRAFT_175538 [Auricularia subglabra TFB-10046 SS5]